MPRCTVPPRGWTSLVAATVLALATLCPLTISAQVSGTVVDQGAPVPFALVRWQARPYETIADLTGAFSLPGVAGVDVVVVAAAKGFFNGGVVVTTPASAIQITLDPVPSADDPNYDFVIPDQCAVCHSDQFDQWSISRMSATGMNTWVYDLYDGTGTAGGTNGFVYTEDSVHLAENPGGYCASCHQPEGFIATPFSALGSLQTPTDPVLRGVSCESCHKIENVDETKINAPGFISGAVTVNRPDLSVPGANQVMYGLLGDVDYSQPGLMRGSFNPQMAAEACAVCHEYNNDPDDDGDFEEASSVPAQETYSEWKNSPYGDPNDPLYATCVDCHMPQYSATPVSICGVLFPPLLREPDTVHGHDIEGTSPAYLENAVSLAMTAVQSGNELEVEVSITNDQAGHSVPTGVTFRNMVLVVEAREAGGGLALAQTSGSTVHPLGGQGDPLLGDYAGQPGKLYMKINEDGAGTHAVVFTEAVTIAEDNRIAPLATDTTVLCFAVPGNPADVEVDARLIYRRAPRPTVVAKGWTVGGLGDPLPDVQPPHYGHLMEAATLSVATVPGEPEFIRGDCNADSLQDISDAISMLGILFSGQGPPECADACDTNDDGGIDIGDAIFLLNALFAGGAPPPPPYPSCGVDPTDTDALDCGAYVCP